jgi:hypothetical protein
MRRFPTTSRMVSPARGEEVRLLQTLHPAGVEYFFVPRDESDSDPAKFGLILQERAPSM